MISFNPSNNFMTGATLSGAMVRAAIPKKTAKKITCSIFELSAVALTILLGMIS